MPSAPWGTERWTVTRVEAGSARMHASSSVAVSHPLAAITIAPTSTADICGETAVRRWGKP